MKVRLVYILSASHSGSTLLAMLLGSHNKICTVGELQAGSLGDINNYRCSCQKFIYECPFWCGIKNDMRDLGAPFDISDSGTDIRRGINPYERLLMKPLHRGPFLEWIRDAALTLSPSWLSHLSKSQKANASLMQCILSRADKNVLVDSSKIGIRLKYLLRNDQIDVKVIRLIRDGRGVALTYMDPAKFADAEDPGLRGGGSGGKRKSERLSIANASEQWRRSNEEAQSILNHLDPSRWIEIHYEKLCEETEDTLHDVFNFIGVGPSISTLNFRSVEHHIIGNGMRLDSSNVVQIDNRWKEALENRDLKIFESIAGALNRKLGYI